MKIANPTLNTLYIISNNDFIDSICLLYFPICDDQTNKSITFQNEHPHLAILTKDIVSLLQFGLSEEIYC